MSRKPSLAPGYRLGVASRALAAIAGGYAVTALLVAALARTLALALGVAPATSVFACSMAAFLIYPLLAMWIFRVARAAQAWRGLALLAAGSALVLWLTPPILPA